MIVLTQIIIKLNNFLSFIAIITEIFPSQFNSINDPSLPAGDWSPHIPAQPALPSQRPLLPRRDDGQQLREQAGHVGLDGEPGGAQEDGWEPPGSSVCLEMPAVSPARGPLWRLQPLLCPSGALLRSVMERDYGNNRIMIFRISNKVWFFSGMKPYKSVVDFHIMI